MGGYSPGRVPNNRPNLPAIIIPAMLVFAFLQALDISLGVTLILFGIVVASILSVDE